MRPSNIPLLVAALVACASVPPVPPPPKAVADDPTARIPTVREREAAVREGLDNLEKALQALERQGEFLLNPATNAAILESPSRRNMLIVDVCALSEFSRDVVKLSDALIVHLRALPSSLDKSRALEHLRPLLTRLRFAIAATDDIAETLGLPRTLPDVPRSFIPI